MKVAFSTLACPEWEIERVVDTAVELGYDGIELRLLDGHVIDPMSDRRAVERAVTLCRDRGVDVCAFDTSCRFNVVSDDERQQHLDDLLHWIALAESLRVPLLRVFGGADSDDVPLAQTGVAEQRVAAALRQAGVEAAHAGVTIALETHDLFSSARRVGRVLNLVASPAVAALWDSHHPYRMGESADDVIAAIGSRVAHVHVKDARREGADDTSWQLVLMGDGEVPVREQLRALRRLGYKGYVSVEWEKKWHPEIAAPEVALPQHIEWLRKVLNAET